MKVYCLFAFNRLDSIYSSRAKAERAYDEWIRNYNRKLPGDLIIPGLRPIEESLTIQEWKVN